VHSLHHVLLLILSFVLMHHDCLSFPRRRDISDAYEQLRIVRKFSAHGQLLKIAVVAYTNWRLCKQPALLIRCPRLAIYQGFTIISRSRGHTEIICVSLWQLLASVSKSFAVQTWKHHSFACTLFKSSLHKFLRPSNGFTQQALYIQVP
jgi:hypothetical protein